MPQYICKTELHYGLLRLIFQVKKQLNQVKVSKATTVKSKTALIDPFESLYCVHFRSMGDKKNCRIMSMMRK